FRPEERRQIQTALATAYTRLGQPEQARQVWEKLAKEHPDDWAVRLTLFRLALERDDQPAMKALITQLRAIEKEDGVLWRDAEARRRVVRAAGGDRAALKPAGQLLGEIAARWPDWGGVPLLEAQIEDLKGKPERALDKYREAMRRGVVTVHAVRRVWEILSAQQRFAEADAVWRQLPRQGELAPELSHAEALVSLRANDTARALASAERAAARGTATYQDHLFLAQVALRDLKPDKAQAALERARDLKPTAPETWTALVTFLAGTGKKE